MSDTIQSSARAEIEKRGWTICESVGAPDEPTYYRATLRGITGEFGEFVTPWFPDLELLLGYIREMQDSDNPTHLKKVDGIESED